MTLATDTMAKRQSPQLPYAHLNLRRNPFGEFSEHERTTLAVVDIDEICRRLSSPTYAVQFVGDKGYGKTTHLLAIRARFSDAAYVHIPEGERAEVPAGCPILVDEAQRLTFWQRRSLFPNQVPLVLGTHRDFTRQLKAAGRHVETIHVADGTCSERLHQVLNDRIAWVQRDKGAVPSVSQNTADELLHEFGPNIRGILHELYCRFQILDVIEEI